MGEITGIGSSGRGKLALLTFCGKSVCAATVVSCDLFHRLSLLLWCVVCLFMCVYLVSCCTQLHRIPATLLAEQVSVLHIVYKN